MGGFGILGDLFMPGARHTEEERERHEWMRDEEGDGAPHHGPIDLSSGVVVMRATKKEPDAEPATPEDAVEDVAEDTVEDAPGGPVGGAAEDPADDVA